MFFFEICKQIEVNDFSEETKIFPTLAHFLKILLMNPHNFSAKHVVQTCKEISVWRALLSVHSVHVYK